MESLGLRSLTKETIATAGKSITGDGTPVSPLQLVNDEINPGVSEYYGTDAAGVKGFYPIEGSGGTPSDIPALPLGTAASPGFSTEVSRYDHVHPFPVPTSIGAVPETRTLTAGTGLDGGGDLTADRTFSVVNDTTIQQIQVLSAGVTVGNRSMVNFIGGGTLQISVSNNPSSNRIDVLVSAAGGSSGGATFIATVLPLGNTGVPGGTADITVSSALTTQRIIATDVDADDMDALILSATCPVDGTVRLNYIAYPGPVAGDRNILLSIG